MAEWSIAPDLKSGGVARHPGVRIPLSPPELIDNLWFMDEYRTFIEFRFNARNQSK